MDVDGDGGWTIVRGKGKERHKGTSLKRARDECCPGGGGAEGACTDPAPPASGGGRGGFAVAAGDGGPWQPIATAKRRGARGGRWGGGEGERTPAEQCDQLLDNIRSCRQEVADSPFYKRLLKVLEEAVAAGHLGHLPFFPPTMPYTSVGDGVDGRQGMVVQKGAVSSDTVGAEVKKAQYCLLVSVDGGGDGGDGGDAAKDQGSTEASTCTSMDMETKDAAAGGATGTAADRSGGGGGSSGGSGSSGWGAIRSLVVYGLGSLHLSRVSRYQLALVLLLRDQVLCGLTSAVQLYDPAFDDVDRLALQQLGLQIMEVDEGGGRRVTEPTFFYMPHCEGELYDALLRANWSSGVNGSGGGGASSTASAIEVVGCGRLLPLVVVLGNSFRQYQERWEMRRAGSGGAGGGSHKAQKAHKARPLGIPGPVVRCCLEEAVVELPTPDLRFPVASAFNSTALHLFPPSYKLDSLLSAGPDAALEDGVPKVAAAGAEAADSMDAVVA